MEALKRYRTGGGQNVTVQKVSIQDGGQAIVGSVNHSPRETGSQSVEVPHLALPDPKSPLPVTDVEFSPVPAKRRSKNDRLAAAQHRANVFNPPLRRQHPIR
jgi:hypothetical protein